MQSFNNAIRKFLNPKMERILFKKVHKLDHVIRIYQISKANIEILISYFIKVCYVITY